jgi:hypothetical protein
VNTNKIIGPEPLEDGMHIAIRIRRDFMITDAHGVLRAARAAYRELNPGTSQAEADESVSSAADAIFIIPEHAGTLRAKADAALAARVPNGLTTLGQRVQVTINENHRLAPGPDCFAIGDVFAQPSRRLTVIVQRVTAFAVFSVRPDKHMWRGGGIEART